jgi:hypothetical protein
MDLYARRFLGKFALLTVLAAGVLAACDSNDMNDPYGDVPVDPATAPRVPVDRFSGPGAILFVRTPGSPFPGANQPIDMDTGPFVTTGLGPNREIIKYYNFDVQPLAPAPIYVLQRQGESSPVGGQLNIVDVIPGAEHYSDFWRVMIVTVPATYVANSVTSVAEITAKGYPIQATTSIVNCPIVPEGSVARLGGGAHGLTHGWYRDQVVAYFNFDEAALATTEQGFVPLAPIFVTFTINPDRPNGGPASGFLTEPGTLQTHNVAARLPLQAGYSPLWSVIPFNNSAFGAVHDLPTATAAPLFPAAGNVNCPIVEVKP